jgi:hypothetical protein
MEPVNSVEAEEGVLFRSPKTLTNLLSRFRRIEFFFLFNGLFVAKKMKNFCARQGVHTSNGIPAVPRHFDLFFTLYVSMFPWMANFDLATSKCQLRTDDSFF